MPCQGPEHRVLITTVPFGERNRLPLDLLEKAGINYTVNALGRRLREEDLIEMVGNCGAIIAGTEPITARVLDHAPHLQLISRVGIGLDSVDLPAAADRGILVSYTPDAPAPAVAELTIALMISCLRCIGEADRHMREGTWKRFMGRRLAQCTVGIIGVGRVGKRVIRHLQGFGPPILANDLVPDEQFGREYRLVWADKETILREADIVSLHVPLTNLTRDLMTRREMNVMKSDAILINTSRGTVVNERDLVEAIKNGIIGGAALDVFEAEPYSGELTEVDGCILTSHMGSMSEDCRFRMELEATEEVIRYMRGVPLQGLVPPAEYEIQRMSS